MTTGPWWDTYSTVTTPELIQLLTYEATTTAAHVYESGRIPGLLQTRDYAHHTIHRYGHTGAALETRTALRMERQQQTPPRHYTFIVDEPAVLRAQNQTPTQIHHLLAAAHDPHNTLRIVPLDATLGAEEAFTLFTLPGRDPVAVCETPTGLYFSADPARVAKYQATFNRITTTALDVTATRAWLQRIAAK
jgi:Domain of unknown function (DUF5753)